MKTFKTAAIALVVATTGFAAPALAAPVIYTETFDGTSSLDSSGTFGEWRNRWFGVNTNASPIEYLFPNNRGTNLTGLTLFDGDSNDGGLIEILFNPVYGAGILEFSFDILSYVDQDLVVYDIGGNTLLSTPISAVSAPYDFAQAKYITVNVASATGVGGFSLLPFGGEGNISIDNLSVSVVPEPSSWAMMMVGFGLIGAALRRRRVAFSFA